MEHWTKPGPVDADHLIEVPVDGVIHAFSVPGLTRPKPHPTGTANERTDHDHQHPQADKSEEKRPNGKFPLLVGVVAVAEWICVDVWNDHQADDNQRRHHHARYPGVEVDQHLLKAEE